MRVLSRQLLAFLITLAAATDNSPAEAKVWKVISGDGAEVTSECLGSKETIECLVDTAISCSVWSQIMAITADRQTHNDPICDSPGLLYEHDFLVVDTPKRLARYLYFTEQWVLAAKDISAYFANYGARSWKEGDTVVDVFAIRCTAKHTCTKGTVQPFDPEYGAGCPITFCFGYPDESVTYDGEEYDLPNVSFIIRPDGPGWKIVDEYAAIGMGSDLNHHWKPQRCKRK